MNLLNLQLLMLTHLIEEHAASTVPDTKPPSLNSKYKHRSIPSNHRAATTRIVYNAANVAHDLTW